MIATHSTKTFLLGSFVVLSALSACSSQAGDDAATVGGAGAASTSAGAAGSHDGGAASAGRGGAENAGGAAVGGSNGLGGGSSSGGAGSASAGTSGSSFGGRSSGSGGASSGGFGGQGASGGGVGGHAGGSATNGGAANGGASGSGGGTDFQPCPQDGTACKILPLGDSITWGIQYEGAYRVELFSKAVAAGQKITFTGSLSDGPNTVANMPFPKNNEGHSGWTIAQDTGLVPTPAFTTIPNIVLLMIGTNDIYAASGQADAPTRLGTLIDKIVSTAPSALVVVAKITPLANSTWNATVKTYNDAIPGVVQARSQMGKHVILADMNTGFTAAMLSSDGIHPNQTGYNFMGDAWYGVISAYLPK